MRLVLSDLSSPFMRIIIFLYFFYLSFNLKTNPINYLIPIIHLLNFLHNLIHLNFQLLNLQNYQLLHYNQQFLNNINPIYRYHLIMVFILIFSCLHLQFIIVFFLLLVVLYLLTNILDHYFIILYLFLYLNLLWFILLLFINLND